MEKDCTIWVMHEHPLEFPEGPGEVFQLVVEVDVLLYQCMNGVLQFKAPTLQEQQGQGHEEKHGPRSPHSVPRGPCHIFRVQLIPSRQSRVEEKWSTAEMITAEYFTGLNSRGGDSGLFLSKARGGKLPAGCFKIHPMFPPHWLLWWKQQALFPLVWAAVLN